jgi:hypothetical protein
MEPNAQTDVRLSSILACIPDSCDSKTPLSLIASPSTSGRTKELLSLLEAFATLPLKEVSIWFDRHEFIHKEFKEHTQKEELRKVKRSRGRRFIPTLTAEDLDELEHALTVQFSAPFPLIERACTYYRLSEGDLAVWAESLVPACVPVIERDHGVEISQRHLTRALKYLKLVRKQQPRMKRWRGADCPLMVAVMAKEK